MEISGSFRHSSDIILVVDTETTGLDLETSRVISLAIVPHSFSGYLPPDLNKRFWMFNPECPIPEESSAIHGLYDEDVKDYHPFRDLALDIRKIFWNYTVVAHNVEFDIPMINAEFERAGVPILDQPLICTMKAGSRFRYGKWIKLDDLLDEFGLDPRQEDDHDAYEDALKTLEVAKKLYELDSK